MKLASLQNQLEIMNTLYVELGNSYRCWVISLGIVLAGLFPLKAQYLLSPSGDTLVSVVAGDRYSMYLHNRSAANLLCRYHLDEDSSYEFILRRFKRYWIDGMPDPAARLEIFYPDSYYKVDSDLFNEFVQLQGQKFEQARKLANEAPAAVLGVVPYKQETTVSRDENGNPVVSTSDNYFERTLLAGLIMIGTTGNLAEQQKKLRIVRRWRDQADAVYRQTNRSEANHLGTVDLYEAHRNSPKGRLARRHGLIFNVSSGYITNAVAVPGPLFRERSLHMGVKLGVFPERPWRKYSKVRKNTVISRLYFTWNRSWMRLNYFSNPQVYVHSDYVIGAAPDNYYPLLDTSAQNFEFKWTQTEFGLNLSTYKNRFFVGAEAGLAIRRSVRYEAPFQFDRWLVDPTVELDKEALLSGAFYESGRSVRPYYRFEVGVFDPSVPRRSSVLGIILSYSIVYADFQRTEATYPVWAENRIGTLAPAGPVPNVPIGTLRLGLAYAF